MDDIKLNKELLHATASSSAASKLLLILLERDVAKTLQTVCEIYGDEPAAANALRSTIATISQVFSSHDPEFQHVHFRNLAGAQLLDAYAADWPKKALSDFQNYLDEK